MIEQEHYMPIKDKSLYPPPDVWQALRMAILERSENCCEECLAPNRTEGCRDEYGQFYTKAEVDAMTYERMCALFGPMPKLIQIVLTIAHIDHDPGNNSLENLRAWCQRCHLAHDREQHAETARQTRAKKSGQLALFEAMA